MEPRRATARSKSAIGGVASQFGFRPDAFLTKLSAAGDPILFSTYLGGATDDFGYRAIEDVCTIYDLHATLLYLLGIDHERLTYYHNGVERRLTDVHGAIINEILA